MNVYGGGSLTFDDAPLDFWAASILIESQGVDHRRLARTADRHRPGGRLTFHLDGQDQGAAPFGTAAGQGGQGITWQVAGRPLRRATLDLECH